MSATKIDADAFNAFEAAGWEKITDPYHRVWGPVTSRIIDPLLDAARVGSGMKVLDVATGPGYGAARAAQRGASAVGVDVATQMVALATKLHPGAEFRQADAERLPFPDRSFDAVVGNFVVLHLGRPEQGVAELARVLIPGGHLALSMWDGPERAHLLSFVFHSVQEVGAKPPASVPAGPPFFRFSSDEEFSALLRSVGLEAAAVRSLSFTHRLSGSDELWEGMVAGTVRTASMIRGQTEETQRRIRAALHRRVSEYAVAGGLEVPVSVKIASGRKPGLAA